MKQYIILISTKNMTKNQEMIEIKLQSIIDKYLIVFKRDY